MRKKHIFLCMVCLCAINTSIGQTSLSPGDIAFIGFNTDGDDDFSIVVLSDITNKTIYFSDNETNGTGGFIDNNEGVLTWITGIKTIKSGTVINFNDTDNESNIDFGASIGSLSRSSGSFSLSASTKDGIVAYLGTDENIPTTFIAAIQIGNDSAELGSYDLDGVTLTGTGLVKGTSIIIFDDSATPDGAVYNASRSSQGAYSNYYSLIADDVNNWTNVVNGDGETLLPFSQEAFTTNTTTWTGGTSSVWNLAGNWDNGIPTSSSFVSIPNVPNSPIISSGVSAVAGNITIDTGEILTINSANSLTLGGILTISGDLTINSGGSLIVSGTSTGNLTYSVNVGDTNWHLVSSPVLGEQYDDAWNTTNSINVSGAGLNDAVSTYNNTTSVSGSWNYFQTGGVATNFNPGQGYSLKRISAGNYGFIGTFPTSDVLLTISQGFGTLNKWNLIGNPFPSYIKASDLITANSLNLTDTHEFVYVWNGTNYVALGGTDYIHPGQGFFVNADNSTADNFVITESLQSHQTGVTFYKGSQNPTIKVLVKDQENNQKFTEIKYLKNSTKGLDPGFDAGTFTGQSTSFSLYTHLASNSNGVNFMLQSLPDDDYENTVIPLGLNAVSGKEITFSIEHQNLPNGLMVFLEDTQKKTITRLDENTSTYKVLLDDDSNGIGRFYVHTSTSDLRKVLNLYTKNLNQVSVYLSSDRNLRIVGLRSDTSTLSIYTILGTRVYYNSLKAKTLIDIDLSDAIKQGIYIVQLNTNEGNMNKKIFLK